MLKPNVYYLWLYAGTTPKPQPVQTIWQAQYTVRPGEDGMIFPHALETADVAPAFTPSWNTVVYPVEITSTYVRARFAVPAPTRAATVDYSISRGTSVAVSAGSTSATVTHNLNDASAVILFSANWNTVVRISTKAANSATVDFSVPAPTGAFLYYGQHASSSDITSTESVVAGADFHVVNHNADRAFLAIFVQPHWNTTVTWQTKNDLNETVLKFGAPSYGVGTLDTRVKGIGNMTTDAPQTAALVSDEEGYGEGLYGEGDYGA